VTTPQLPPGAVIAEGAHETFGAGSCALEWVDYLDRTRRGEGVAEDTALTDHPACVCPVVGAFVRSWNDALGDDDRQRLLAPLLLLTLDTATGEADSERRAWMAADWLVRVHAPAWLDLAGLTDHAAALRAQGVINSAAAARAAQGQIDAAWAAAWDAARDAARVATMASAIDAARASAIDAAWAAAWDAARDAARGALRPTVLELQASAADLVRRMCAVGWS
jgi:hypothetical protein